MQKPQMSGVTISTLPELHKDSFFEPPCVIHATLAPHNLIQVGAFSGVYGGKVGHSIIGRYCSIAPGVDIASDQHPTDWLSSSMVQYVSNIHGWGSWLKEQGYAYNPSCKNFDSNSPVTIGNDVWIGQGVFIKSGVKIGDGAIIAAHSVVLHDIPPYAICAGVPAKVKRLRFDEKLIDRLLTVRWWDYNITGLEQIDFSSPQKALDTIESAIANNTLLPYSPTPHYMENYNK
ncbi:transferase hexapeptide (six repeat-containing protein) [Azotobacter beijerinckii]|uniref:Transferase hexapeptide (Six repeat-containing protein) n=1 Tax=Azotobacter beijerinckii TaxID=170623 RepID=A0A1H6WJN8_9GAMM|nr:CatB-related O-acetyltransferase [Azotobacter beijerinckii]SEJ14337.1 transferase hexapeptide (six repeat-containing protein) [Azotobacter beijerinckii]